MDHYKNRTCVAEGGENVNGRVRCSGPAGGDIVVTSIGVTGRKLYGGDGRLVSFAAGKCKQTSIHPFSPCVENW